LNAGSAEINEQNVTISLEVGVVAFEIIAATRGESDEQILMHLFDECGIAAHQAYPDERFVSSLLRLASCAEPASHIVYTPA
jgi:hypothetical protein